MGPDTAFAFEMLIIDQKSVDFADQILAMTEPSPQRDAFLANQLNRASVSIAANPAEGTGRFTTPDRTHSFGIARGSIQECMPLLDYARRQEHLGSAAHKRPHQRWNSSVRWPVD